MRTLPRGVVGLFLSLTLAATASAQVIPSNVTPLNLPTPGTFAVTPVGINDHGVVAVNALCFCPTLYTWDVTHGWTGVDGPYQIASRSINENGAIISMTFQSDHNGGLIWDPSTGFHEMQLGPGVIGLFPTDINDNGVVVGNSWIGPFMYSAAAGPTFLTGIEPRAINNAGTMVGDVPSFADPTELVLREVDGTLRRLSPGSRGQVNDINNAGQAVGWVGTFAGAQGVVWAADGTPTLIPPAGGWFDDEFGLIARVNITAINEHGQAVGWSTTTTPNVYLPFVWDAASGMREIVVPGNSGNILPVDINNNGEVVAVISAFANRGLYFTVPIPTPPPPPDPGYTGTGTNVTATPIDPSTGTSPVGITFGNVTSAGTTTLTTSSTNNPPPPSNFKLGTPSVYYDLTTTATFTGAATVCINYSGVTYSNESQLRLRHLENGVWVDRTVSLDTTAKIICASVTSFSPFVITEPNYVRLTITPGTARRGAQARIEGEIENPSATDAQHVIVEIATDGVCAVTGLKSFPVHLKPGETQAISFPLPVTGQSCPGTYTVTLTVRNGDILIGDSAATLTVVP